MIAGGPGRIAVEGVSKRYHLSGTRGLLRSLVFPPREEDPDCLWALRDVTFAVQPGEAFAVVGHNGAGKSTLLKLLAGIMQPTRGRIDIQGRLGCLIEVGAGFHPELTGRENVFLNGAILGMKRREIARRLDSIVAYAELEQFLDVPVKRYSSGMFMRLGFSVAVHAQPEVLLVDEVLAVGDQAFQLRCLNTIADLRRQGTAVVLVSHSFFTVLGVCSRAMWLDHGRMRLTGPADEVVRAYERSVQGMEAGESSFEGTAQARFLEAEVEGGGRVACGEALRVRLVVEAADTLPAPVLGFGIVRSDGTTCGASNTRVQGERSPDLLGRHELRLELPDLRLLPGAYRLLLELADSHQTTSFARCALPFHVDSDVPNLEPQNYGVYLPPHRWWVDGEAVRTPRPVEGPCAAERR